MKLLAAQLDVVLERGELLLHVLAVAAAHADHGQLLGSSTSTGSAVHVEGIREVSQSGLLESQRHGHDGKQKHNETHAENERTG